MPIKLDFWDLLAAVTRLTDLIPRPEIQLKPLNFANSQQSMQVLSTVLVKIERIRSQSFVTSLGDFNILFNPFWSVPCFPMMQVVSHQLATLNCCIIFVFVGGKKSSKSVHKERDVNALFAGCQRVDPYSSKALHDEDQLDPTGYRLKLKVTIFDAPYIREKQCPLNYFIHKTQVNHFLKWFIVC